MVTLCGACCSFCYNQIDACNAKCTGCTGEVECGPNNVKVGKPNQSRRSDPVPPSERAVAVAAALKSQAMFDAVSQASHLMGLVLADYRERPAEFFDCVNKTGIVIDKENSGMQSKFFVQFDDHATFIVIVNRSTDMDESLSLHPKEGVWGFHTRFSWARDSNEVRDTSKFVSIEGKL